jgi:hypothetical protein
MSQIIPSSGGMGTVTVATSVAVPFPQGAWTVTSNAAWITPASGGETANPSGTPRTGTITIAGKTFTVTQSGCPLLTISPASLPNGFAGVAYNQMLTSSGAAPHTFSAGAGTLPAGLSLSASGLLSGTPAANGTFTFTINVTDGAGCLGAREYTVIISGSGSNSLAFYPLPASVRLLETRPDFPGFPLTGCTRTNAKIPGNLAMATHTQPAAGFCGLPAAAQAVVGNVSVVNSEGAGFLTLFPGNLATAPLVATSNYPAPATFGYNRHYSSA